MWVLLGIAIIVAGFLLRFHPLLVILASAIVTGLAADLDLLTILAAFGKAFNEARYVSIIWIVLPVVGLLEAYGLQERARGLIAKMRGATVESITASITSPGPAGTTVEVRGQRTQWQSPSLPES